MTLYRYAKGPATPGPCLVCGLTALPIDSLRFQAPDQSQSRAHRACLRLSKDWTPDHRPPGDIEVTPGPPSRR